MNGKQCAAIGLSLTSFLRALVTALAGYCYNLDLGRNIKLLYGFLKDREKDVSAAAGFPRDD